MSDNNYKDKIEARRERLLERAAGKRARAGAASRAARGALAGIEPGQPILVGHHSQRSHERAIERSDAQMRRSMREAATAEELERRAAAVGTGGVSSDDPEALEKLRIELADEEAGHALGLKVNKAWRKALKATGGDKHAAALHPVMVALGLRGSHATFVAHRISTHPVGMLRDGIYNTANSAARVRRLKQRITELEDLAQAPERESVRYDDVGIVVDDLPRENRVAVTFDTKPSKEVCKVMRRHGLVYSRMLGAWVRKRGNGWEAALRAAEAARAIISRDSDSAAS